MSISTDLENIQSAVYGRDVRQSIHDAIQECYEDVSNPALNTAGFRAVLEQKIQNGTLTGVVGIKSVNSKSQMTDHSTIYLMTNHLYFWNGSDYESIPTNTDFNALEDRVDDSMSDTQDDIEEALSTHRQQVETQLTNAQSQNTQVINAYKDEINGRFATLRNNLEDEIEDFENDVTAQINEMSGRVTSISHGLDTVQSNFNDINTAFDVTSRQVTRLALDATELSQEALAKAEEATNQSYETESYLDDVQEKMDLMEYASERFVSDMEVTPDGLVYLLHDNERVSGPHGPFAGSGGGGGSSEMNNAVLTVSNTTGWAATTVADGDQVEISYSWTSIEDNMPTGSGTQKITVNGSIKSVSSVGQGLRTIDITEYLTVGGNQVKINIADVYGNSKTVNFNITVVAIRIESTFDSSNAYTGSFMFSYTPTGKVEKTVYFKVDGTLLTTVVTSVTGRQLSQVIPQQAHGRHSLEVYFDCTINSQLVESNHLFYEIICLEVGNSDPIITSAYRQTSVPQYSSNNIPYTVYSPNSMESEITITDNGVTVATLTIDRSEQIFSWQADTAGERTFVIRCGTVTRTFTITVEASSVVISPETESLSLYLTANGRSNAEAHPESWISGSVSATLSSFSFIRDGWQKDDNGFDVLRVVGDARVSIPYKIFQTDFKSSGKTIEIEFATREVTDYTATILSCMSGNVGLTITPQNVVFKGSQNEINTLYKDNEHVRLSIVVGKQNNYRLILIYINGIMSRAIQYASGERFSQLSPVNISIGSNDCGIDIYNIRVYDNDLTREQIVNNWIADTQDSTLKIQRYQHNDIYDDYGAVSIPKLPSDLPYIIIDAEELPQYKGDKKTVSGSYTDPIFDSKSFTFTGCEIDVQGTSSAVYYRKNYDMKFKQGFVMSSGLQEKYALRTGSIPNDRFVIKADVASSESTNNTGLTMFFNDTCPYKTAEMIADPRVRHGIEGIPIVVFWRDGNSQLHFLGKHNFNLPKRAPNPLGYTGNMQSWEWERNNSTNVKFQSSDFTTMAWNEVDQEYYPEWYDDFEARFPSDEWRDYTQLKEILDWVVSTDRNQATNANLPEPVTFRLANTVTVNDYSSDSSYTIADDGSTGYKLITFTKDTPAYRLSKFKAEVAERFEMESAYFYYLYTELFLMIDSRAKNMFIGFKGSPVTLSGSSLDRKAVFEPYDMDTAIGTNNSGVLMFGYYLEDTDTVSSVISGGDSGGTDAPVFNAQDSVFWVNVRDSCRSELTAMYRSLRANRTWSYNAVETRYEEHQAKWPEAVFNEDAYEKYLVPLVNPVTVDEITGQLIRTDRYLTMLQGSKTEQRKWWLSNRFRYLDSKYVTGDATSNMITMRLFNSGTMTLTPAIDMYLAVSFGGGTTVSMQRTTTNTPKNFTYTSQSGVTEMETWIYSADLITDVGDLSVFYPNELDFSKATRLRTLKIGDSTSGYSNANLRALDVRNSALLEEIDVRNCPNLAITVNLEGSPHLKEAYFDGTAITGVDLVDGGELEVLHLPSTITTLTLMNLSKLEELSVASYANVTRLMLANMDQDIIDPMDVLADIPAGSQVFISGLFFEADDAEEIEDFLDLLDTMTGVTRDRGQNGDWIYRSYDTAQVSGTIHTTSLTGAQVASYNARYPYITVTADHVTSYLTYKSYDGATTLKTVTCIDGVPQDTAPAGPSRTSTAQYTFTFIGWNANTDANVNDPACVTNVIGDRTVYAAYSATVNTYTVYFYNGSTLLQTVQNVPYGGSVTYTGSTPVYTGTGDPNDYEFSGWSPAPTNIQANTSCYAQFSFEGVVNTISDDLTTLMSKCDAGNVSEYSIGDTKKISMGTMGYTSIQLVAKNADPLASGSGNAHTTWIMYYVLPVSHRMNPAREGSSGAYTEGTGSIGGWDKSEMKQYILDTVVPNLPEEIRNAVKTVTKYTRIYNTAGSAINDVATEETFWLASRREMFGAISRAETQGPIYSEAFPDNASRVKSKVGASSASWWWLRSASFSNYFRYVDADGSDFDNYAYSSGAVALGFCI